MMEEKRREELLRTTTVASTGHVQISLENDQNELRHHNRMNRTNDGNNMRNKK